MKNNPTPRKTSYLHALALAAVVTLAAPLPIPAAAASHQQGAAAQSPGSIPPNDEQMVESKPPRIQLAILLDTSNSMDGLIDQAKTQLWNIVGQFSKTKLAGETPELEVALYQYGNDGLPAIGYPAAEIADGTESRMRNYNDLMSVQELVDVVSYLQPQFQLRVYEPTVYRGYHP